MENFVPTHLQEVIYSSSNKKIRKQIAMLESTGKIKKITQNIVSEVIKRNKDLPVSEAIKITTMAGWKIYR